MGRTGVPWRALAAVYAVAMWGLSLQPHPPDPSARISFAHVDKLKHLLEYGVFSLLLALALRPRPWPRRSWPLLLVVGTVAAVDEGLQSLAPGRVPSGADWGVDVAAAVLVVFAFLAYHGRLGLTKDAAAPGGGRTGPNP